MRWLRSKGVKVEARQTGACFSRAAQPVRTDSKDGFLDQLRLVGQKKLMGYLPQSTITNLCNEDPRALQKEAQEKGLTTLLLGPQDCSIGSGALYVYDSEKLQDFLLLPSHKAILDRYCWPVAADEFVWQTIRMTASSDHQTPLYDLIALAYNDPRPFYQAYQPAADGPVPFSF